MEYLVYYFGQLQAAFIRIRCSLKTRKPQERETIRSYCQQIIEETIKLNEFCT